MRDCSRLASLSMAWSIVFSSPSTSGVKDASKELWASARAEEGRRSKCWIVVEIR